MRINNFYFFEKDGFKKKKQD